MESMFKKSLFSLLIIMALLITIPVAVHATDEAIDGADEGQQEMIENVEYMEDYVEDMEDYEEDMPELPPCSFLHLANKIVYFGGDTYSPFAFNMEKAKPNGNCDPGTAGLVISANSRNNTIVVASAALKGLRKIKYEQVTEVRAEGFLQFDFEGDRAANLNIKFAGENTELIFENGTDGAFSAEGAISVGFENAFSRIRLVKNGEDVAEFYLINDGSGHLSIAFGDGFNVSSDMAAAILDKIRLGGIVEFAIDSTGRVDLAGAATVNDNEVVRGEAEGVPEDGDFGVGGQVTILGYTIGDKTNHIPVIETVRKVVNVIKGLISKLPVALPMM